MVALDSWLIDMEGNFVYTLDIQPCDEPHEDCDCEVEVYVRRFDNSHVVTRWESELADPKLFANTPWKKPFRNVQKEMQQMDRLLDMMLESK